MSYYDRMGNESYRRPGLFRGFRFFPPVIRWLFVLNVAAWLLLDVLLRLFPFSVDGYPVGRALSNLLALFPLGDGFWPWQIITYMFLHGGLFHLLFNMLALWIFGMEIENLWGSKRFLIFYLLCGIGGAAGNLLVAPLLGQTAPVIGASGAVFGVMTAFALHFPNRPIYIYFLLPIPAKFLVIGWIALDLIYGVAGSSDGIAHFAHLGGAGVGVLLTLAEMRNIPFLSSWSRLFADFRNPFASGSAAAKRGSDTIQDARFYDIKTGKKKEEGERVSQEVVDSILDKIAAGGYQSLTDEEKRILNEASRKLH